MFRFIAISMTFTIQNNATTMRNSQHAFRAPILTLLLSFWMIPVLGQVSYQATYYQGAGNPGGKNTETDFNTTGWNMLMPGSQMTNRWSNPGNIPFQFEFFGEQVSFFRASANGQLTFDMTSPTPGGNNGTLPNAVVPDSTILCFWERFTTTPPIGSNDKVETKVFGTAPNRQMWIRWHSYEWGPCSFAYLAVVLEESTNKIYVVDLFSSSNASQVTSTVGIQANQNFAVTAATDIPLSGAGSSNGDNSYYEFTPYLIEPYDMNAISIDAPFGDGCGLGQETVTVSVSNVGLFTATGMTARFSVDGGAYTSPEVIPGSIAPGDTVSYTFIATANVAAMGQHDINVVLQVTGDNNNSNDSMSATLNNLVSVSSFPYEENFENGSGGWEVGGTNASWERGFANNTTIIGAASGINAWVTGRTGPHNANEDSWVMSPCFDFSTLGPNPAISVNVWWESEFSWDGAVMQSSIDAGQTWQNVGAYGDPNNWYTDNSINSLPGFQSEGWTGEKAGNTGSDGWVNAQTKLNPSLIGEPKVLFRVAFGSDGSSNSDGFAFDDVTIASAPILDLGPDQFFCQGAQLDVGPANQNATIEWSTGASTPTITLQNFTGAPIIDSTVIVTVTNGLGLIERDTINFSMTVPPLVQVNGVTKVDCYGESSGSIDITMVGGASPFTYTWDNGSTVQDPGDLPAGTYSGNVTDINGCQATIPPISVPENSELIASETHLDASCFGDSTAEITANISGGVGPYQVVWNTGQTGTPLMNIPAGSYSATITDDKGCETLIDATVTEPDSLVLSADVVTDATCIDAADGSISIELAGGTSPYTFFWDHGDSSQVTEGLAPGSYSGYVLDSNNCFLQLPTYAITYNDSIPVAGFGVGMAGAMVGFKDSSVRASTYFWDFGDGVTSDKQQPVHQYNTNGVFTVTQVVSNPCGSDTTTQEVNIISASLEDEWKEQMQIAPNPSHGSFRIDLSTGWSGQGSITVYNINGQEVWTEHRQLLPQTSVEVNLPGTLARGLYLVAVKQGDRMVMRKLELN